MYVIPKSTCEHLPVATAPDDAAAAFKPPALAGTLLPDCPDFPDCPPLPAPDCPDLEESALVPEDMSSGLSCDLCGAEDIVDVEGTAAPLLTTLLLLEPVNDTVQRSGELKIYLQLISLQQTWTMI